MPPWLMQMLAQMSPEQRQQFMSLIANQGGAQGMPQGMPGQQQAPGMVPGAGMPQYNPLLGQPVGQGQMGNQMGNQGLGMMPYMMGQAGQQQPTLASLLMAQRQRQQMSQGLPQTLGFPQ